MATEHTPTEPIFRSLYSAEKGMIACVLLQAAYQGDRQPCHYFGTGDWMTSPPDKTFGWYELPRSVWRKLGLMTREERIELHRRALAATKAQGERP